MTSTVLPADEFPQFESWRAATTSGANAPFEPIEGDWYVAGPHEDAAYRRLTRTIDLTGSPPRGAEAPGAAQLEHGDGYDHVIVEAHTAAAGTGRRCPT